MLHERKYYVIIRFYEKVKAVVPADTSLPHVIFLIILFRVKGRVANIRYEKIKLLVGKVLGFLRQGLIITSCSFRPK